MLAEIVASCAPSISHTKKTAWLFPGQGSQSVGMARDLFSSFAPARTLLDQASEMMGINLGICIARGPDLLLTRTDNLQPAITVVDMACCMYLQEAGYTPDLVAGHSLGEFSALYAAGVLDADSVLRLVIARGRLMHETASKLNAGMIAVKGVSLALLQDFLRESRLDQQIVVANINTPEQIVLSGAAQGIARAQELLAVHNWQTVKLNVSGPWHSPLMEPASLEFIKVLHGVKFHDARVPIVMNVSGKAETRAAQIRAYCKQQLCSPVQWADSMLCMHAAGVAHFVEVGPGKVLRGLLRGIPGAADSTVVNFDGPKALRFLEPQT
jgi:[acyl-carrier-protein] S-malonyltransferase